MDAERRFLEALQGVEAFAFEIGKLSLRYGGEGSGGVLILERQQADGDTSS
jgi:heat shock protein HslJ